MNAYETPNYFDWLCMCVGAGYHGPFYNYRNLLERLYQTDYNPTIDMDQARFSDGLNLRYYYDTNRSDFIGYGYINVAPYHPNGHFKEMYQNYPCSILEMMIMFANKINASYLVSYECDRTLVWFWMMIEAMGLANYNDWNFDLHEENNDVDIILRNFNAGASELDEYGYFVPTVKMFITKQIGPYPHSLWDQMNRWYSEYGPTLENIDIEEYINYFISQYNK